MEDGLRSLYKRAMFGFCRAMFSADLGHSNAAEVLKRTWREHGTYLVRALSDGLAMEDPLAAVAELDRRFGEMVGFQGRVERHGDGLVSRWEQCPLWEEMKAQCLEKAFTCVAGCDALSRQTAAEISPELIFERGNQMPRGGPCEKLWRLRDNRKVGDECC